MSNRLTTLKSLDSREREKKMINNYSMLNFVKHNLLLFKTLLMYIYSQKSTHIFIFALEVVCKRWWQVNI